MNGWRVEGFNEVKKLGAGAQGRVVLAVPEGGGGQVAIKYLAPALLSDGRSLEVFRREAETLARVADTHVARLFRYVEGPQVAAIVMEAVEGASLREVLDGAGGALSPESALAVLKGSLLGLAAAHAVGVVHRDYKPANVVVQPEGGSKLIDFGIAVLSGQSSRSGTPAYMAPEQWEGGPASPATDLYAASCVFFECLTGAKPYRGGSTAQLMAQHLNSPVPVDGVPEQVRSLVARGMAKSPGERLWDAGAFVAELERTAVAAYGPDWERRGVRALAVAVAALAPGVPAAMLGSFAAEGTAPTAPAVSTAPAVQQGAGAEAGRAAAQHGRGFVRRAGGAKAAAGAAAVAVAVVAVGGVVVAERRSGTATEPAPSTGASGGGPTPTTVGGQVTGRLRVGFRNPEPFRADRGPSMAYDFTVEPARIKRGTKLSITMKMSAQNPPIKHSFGLGLESDTAERIGFYRTPPADSGTLPTGMGTPFPGHWRKTGETQHGDLPGGWRSTRSESVVTVTIPADAPLRPGRYLLSPVAPPTVGAVSIEDEPVSPESVGAYTQGSLPMVTVLPGTAPRPTTSASGATSSPPPSGRPTECPTFTQADGDRIVRC